MNAPLLLLLAGLAAGALADAPTDVSAPALDTPASSEAVAVEVPVGVACGLGRGFHAGRRAALRAELGEGLVVFRGLPPTRGYTVFHQDKTFWYMTGVETPNAALVMDAATGEEVLFLPAANPNQEGWEGELWDVEDAWVPPLTGFSDVRDVRTLPDWLEQRLDGGGVVWISKEPWVALSGCFDRARPYDRALERDPLDGRVSREQALEDALLARYGVEVRDCQKQLAELRRVKTPEEVDAMRRAAEAGSEAMAEAIRSTRPGVGEWELEAVMDLVHRLEGATGPAYHGICGSGPNSNVLHYQASARLLGAGEMMLIDYAPEVDHYVSDITRSWPTDGVFTPRMAELYDAVLASQQAGIDAVRPGATIADVERACAAVLRERGFGALIRHGACHYIGMEVHDVGDYAKPLEPGVAFTVEPGLYDREANVGIRIEDVVVVTADGCEVVSAGVPKTRAAMEELVAASGLLDRERPDGQ